MIFIEAFYRMLFGAQAYSGSETYHVHGHIYADLAPFVNDVLADDWVAHQFRSDLGWPMVVTYLIMGYHLKRKGWETSLRLLKNNEEIPGMSRADVVALLDSDGWKLRP